MVAVFFAIPLCHISMSIDQHPLMVAILEPLVIANKEGRREGKRER